MDNVLQVKSAIKEDRCKFGTVDSWLLWVLEISERKLLKTAPFISFYSESNRKLNTSHGRYKR